MRTVNHAHDGVVSAVGTAAEVDKVGKVGKVGKIGEVDKIGGTAESRTCRRVWCSVGKCSALCTHIGGEVTLLKPYRLSRGLTRQVARIA